MTVQSRTHEDVPIKSIRPHPNNPRKHSRDQIRALARSMETFGFTAPVLVDRNDQIVAGHGRYEAAMLLGRETIPIIRLDDLSEEKARAYMLADNKLSDRSEWDTEKLGRHFKELREIELNFELEDTGFATAEIDLHIQCLDDDDADRADEFVVEDKPAVSRPGDCWHLGDHRLYCGSALDNASYAALFSEEKAAAVFTDPPYNVAIKGTVGRGATKHREFLEASGELSPQQFTEFLTTFFGQAVSCIGDGALIYACMDFRHMGEILAAGNANSLELLNLCVWVKTNGGMGSLYRGQHELVFVYRKPGSPHQNNVQLGRFGRNRTNVWTYPGAMGLTGKDKKNTLSLHPTVKPIALVKDAILDCTKIGEIVLDPFLGSGTTILAAERTGRRGYGVELDPRYVDVGIERWQRMTGRQASLPSGATFEQTKTERSVHE
jgi:DNA modification methylase